MRQIGTDQHNAVLDPDKVRAIRISYESERPITMRQIGARYNVSVVAIYKVIHRKSWAHVK